MAVALHGNNPHFSSKPSCFICTEDFDDKNHIPKVLECGHTMCVACITRMIASIQVLIVGDGELQTNLSCTVCNQSMPIPRQGARGFATNYQLMDVMKPSDSRIISCTECYGQANESSFHICRECTIVNHSYDITDLINNYGDIELSVYAICSTCALSNHNDDDHTLVKFYFLRNYWNSNKNIRIVKPIGAEVQKNFDEVRTILATTPLLMSNFVKEVEKMTVLMNRCKSSEQQKSVLTRYQQEMGYVNNVFANLKKTIGALNGEVSNKTTIARDDNEKVAGLYCQSEVQNIEQILSKCMEKKKKRLEKLLMKEKEREDEEKEIVIEPLKRIEKIEEVKEMPSEAENGKENESLLIVKICELICISFAWSVGVVSNEVKNLMNKNANNAQQLPVKFVVLTIWLTFMISVLFMFTKMLF